MESWDSLKAIWLLLLTVAGAIVSALGKRSLSENDERHRAHERRMEGIAEQLRELEQRSATKVDVATGFDRLEAKIEEQGKVLQALTTKVEVLIARAAPRRKS